MGWLSDNLDFEKFALKDMWDRLRDDPKRLFLGVDPLSTGVWNQALGRDDQPIMNQLGGPMGGDTLGMGGGGIYDRAEAQGINTGPAEGMHNIAEVVAGVMGGQGAMQGLGNINFGGGAGGAEGGGGLLGGDGGGIMGGGDGGGMFGGEGGMFDFGSMDWSNPQTYQQFAGMMGGGGGGQGGSGTGAATPPIQPMQSTPSPFQLGQTGMYGQAAPANRQTILGLLSQTGATDDEMQKILGGLL